MTAAAIEGKVALVTGGSRGIGRAIALALARAGADVAVNFRAEEKAALEVCAEIEKLGRRSIAVKADVSMTAAVAALVSSVEDGLGDISILVNNAGIAKPRPLDEVTEELWMRQWQTTSNPAFSSVRPYCPVCGHAAGEGS